MKKTLIILIVFVFGYHAIGQSNSKTELKHKIDDLFESYVGYNRFIGNVIISKGEDIIYQKSFGYANLEADKKNTKKTIFSIASVTKAFTGVAIMKLVETGKLTLESPISTYFPGFMTEHANGITLRHLLNHSSGMQANIGRIDESGVGFMPDENQIEIEQVLEKFKDSKLKFESGKGYEYNNFGYVLLAQIIEKASGKTYANYLEQAIFKPANMNHSASAIFKNLNQKAFPYSGLGMDKFEVFKSSIHPSWITGAGDINATAIDLYKFMQALENGTLLNPESVEKLYSSTQSMEMNDMKSGLGWVIDRKADEEWIYHTGLLPGYASIIGSLPKRNVKIIILSNATTGDPTENFQGEDQFVSGEITDKILALIQGKAIETLPIPVSINADIDVSTPKSYKLDKEHGISLKKIDNELWLESIGAASWSVFTYSFSKVATQDNAASKIGLFFAEAMQSQVFEGLGDYANADMKDFLGTDKGIDVLKGMWANFETQFGEFKSYNIYKIEGEAVKSVNIRFHFENNDIGIVLSINADDKIQGMFNDRDVKTSHINKVKLIPIGANEFFINGHKNGGFQDLRVKLVANELLLIDKSKTYKAMLEGSK